MRCEAFAETKSIAEAFLQDATQAPQPMQAAASKAASSVEGCSKAATAIMKKTRRELDVPLEDAKDCVHETTGAQHGRAGEGMDKVIVGIGR